MEPEKQLSPEDVKLVDKIVGQLKSQGIFDQFRKECMADVDTKPAYQNLRQRVDGSVASFLSNHQWRPDLNKNQLRDNLRKHIQNGGFLDIGVERIVDQVVNPKICPVFLPMVEQVVYDCLGVERPEKNEVSNKSMTSVPKPLGMPTYRPQFFPGMRPPFFSRPPPPPTSIPLPDDPQPQQQSSTSTVKDEKPSSCSASSTTTTTVATTLTSLNDILPKDVEPVSPASDIDKREDDGIRLQESNRAEVEEVEEEEEEVSPPFEPHAEVHDENSDDSHISGISELASHNSLNLSRVSSDSIDGKVNKTKQEGETEEDCQIRERHSSDDESSNDSYHEQKTPVIHTENSDHSTVEFTSVKEYHKYQMKSESNMTDDNSDSENSDKEQEFEDRKEWFTNDSKSDTNGRIPSDSFDEKKDRISAGGEEIADESETTGDEQNRVAGGYDVFTDYDDDVSNSSNVIVSASDNDAKTNTYRTAYTVRNNESEKSEDESEKSETVKNKHKNTSSELKSDSKRHKSSHHGKYDDNSKRGEKRHRHRHHHSKDKSKTERHSEKKDKENKHNKSQNVKEKSRHDKVKQNSSSDKSNEKDQSKDKSHKKRKRDESSSKERSKDRKSKKIADEDDEDNDGVNVSKYSSGKKHNKHKRHKSKHKRSRDHCKPRSKDKGNRRSSDRDSNGQGEGSGSHTTDSSSSNRRQNQSGSSLDKESNEHSSNSDSVSELCDNVTEISSEERTDRQMDNCITPECPGLTNSKLECSSEKENQQSPNNISNNSSSSNKKHNFDRHLFLKHHLNFISYNSNGQISKFKKPKIAANIYEVRKVMQMRRYFKKLERQKQLEEEKLQSCTVHKEVNINNSVSEENFYNFSEYNSNGDTDVQLKETSDHKMIQNESDMSHTRTNDCDNENSHSYRSSDSDSDSDCHSSGCDSDNSSSCNTSDSDCGEDSGDSGNEYNSESVHSVGKESCNNICELSKTIINNNTILKDAEKGSGTGDMEADDFKGFHDPGTSQNRLYLEKLLSKLEDDVKHAEEEAHNIDLVTSLLVLNPKYDDHLEQQLGAKVIRKRLVVLPKFTEENYDYDEESGYYILKKLYDNSEVPKKRNESDESSDTENGNSTLSVPKVKQTSLKVEQNDKLNVSTNQIKQNNGQYVKHKRRYTDENINSLPRDIRFEDCNLESKQNRHINRIKPFKISLKKLDEIHAQPVYNLENNVSCNMPSQTNNYIRKSEYIISSKSKTVVPNEYTKTSESTSLENDSSRHWSDVLDMVVGNNEHSVEKSEENSQTVCQLKAMDSGGIKDIDDSVPGKFNKLTNQLIEPALQNLLQESGLVYKGQGQTELSQKKNKRLSSIDRLKLDAQRIMDMQTSSKTLKTVDSDLYKPRHIFGQRSRSRLRGIVNENIDDGETDAVTSSSASSSSSSSSSVHHEYNKRSSI